MKEGVDSSPEYHESANNIGEAKMVQIVYSYLTKEMGLENEQIGIIAPHWAQTATIRAEMEEVSLALRIQYSCPFIFCLRRPLLRKL